MRLPGTPFRSDDPESIRRMFQGLAPDYDRLNRLVTFGRVEAWRRELARAVAPGQGARVVDVCSGTGAMLDALRPLVGPGGLAVGVDFTPEMLAHATGARVLADAVRLPFLDGVFDAAVCSFALRDVADQEAVVREMARVVAPGGRVGILEIGRPRGVAGVGFDIWFRGVVPGIGAAFGHREAHRFLVESVALLPGPDGMLRILARAGLVEAQMRALTLGAAHLFTAAKP